MMMPVSTTATTTLADPVVVCQAVVAPMAEGVVEELGLRYHWPSQEP